MRTLILVLALLLQGCAGVKSVAESEALLALFALLNLADGYTTWHVFRFGGRERTNWIAAAIKRYGLYWTLMAFKVGAVVAVWALNYFYPIPWQAMAGIDALYAWQVYHNWKQLQKHKEG